MLCASTQTLCVACAAFSQMALSNIGHLRQIYPLYEYAYPISGFYEIAQVLRGKADHVLVKQKCVRTPDIEQQIIQQNISKGNVDTEDTNHYASQQLYNIYDLAVKFMASNSSYYYMLIIRCIIDALCRTDYSGIMKTFIMIQDHESRVYKSNVDLLQFRDDEFNLTLISKLIIMQQFEGFLEKLPNTIKTIKELSKIQQIAKYPGTDLKLVRQYPDTGFMSSSKNMFCLSKVIAQMQKHILNNKSFTLEIDTITKLQFQR